MWRSRTKGDEAAKRKGDEVPVRTTERGSHAEHCGGEDQHQHMVDDMRDIDEADHTPR
jgi:hypothetical protein